MSDISLTIRTQDLLVKDGDRFLVSQEGEEAILRFLEIKSKVEEAERQLKEILTQRMVEAKIAKVEGEKVKIIRRAFGSLYRITNPVAAKQHGYAKVKEVLIPDTEAIEAILHGEGKLPVGIEANPRQETVVISSSKENKGEEDEN